MLIAQKIIFPLTSEELKQIKIGTNYDFKIQNQNLKNELGANRQTPARFNSNKLI